MNLDHIEACPCGTIVTADKTPWGLKFTCPACGLMLWQGSTSTWADQETFELRKRVHERFDPWWRSGDMTRNQAYKQLSERLGISKRKCHFGMMTKEQLKAAMEELMK